MRKVFGCVVLVALLSACGDDSPEVSASGSDDDQTTSTTASSALSNVRLQLPASLPHEGIAIDVLGEGVRLVALDGTVVATYRGATFHRDEYFSDTPEAGEFKIWNASGELEVGSVIPADDAPTTKSPYADCEISDERGGTTLLLCGPSTPNVAVYPQTIERVSDGKRSEISGPAHPAHAEVGPVGRLASAELSPTATHVLALWSGECEIPETYVFSLDGSERSTFPGNGTPMGWSADGAALALLGQPACGDARVPGVYAMTPGQAPRLVVALPEPDPSQTNYGVLRWSSDV